MFSYVCHLLCNLPLAWFQLLLSVFYVLLTCTSFQATYCKCGKEREMEHVHVYDVAVHFLHFPDPLFVS
jgi:hypothetical protein